MFNCFISCQNVAHVQTPFPFLLGLQISLETRTNSERREQILAQSCLRADQTWWSCCVILSNTIVLRRGVVGTVRTINGSFTSEIYYAITIVITIRLKNGLYTHFYRPQQSCGKVMFLHQSVILFTGGSLSRGVCRGRGGLCPEGLCQGYPLHTVMCGQYTSY